MLIFSFIFPLFPILTTETLIKNTKYADNIQNLDLIVKSNKYLIDSSVFINQKTPIFLSFSSQTGITTRKQFSSDFTLSNSKFENCSSLKENGGAIFAKNSKAKLINNNFFECSAINGGACYLTNSSVSFNNCNIFKCKSIEDGSALFLNKITGSLENMSIVKNAAGRNGAVVAVKSTINIKYMQLYSNFAENNYGGLCFNETGGVLLVIHFHDNNAKGEIGKSMCIWSSQELILENSYFHDSIPMQLAFTDDSSVRINNIYFKDNKPQDYTIKNGGGGQKFFVYNPTKAPTLPKIPGEFFLNTLKWRIESKRFSWGRLLIIALIFVIAFSVVINTIPSLITPPTKQFQWNSV